MGIEQEIESAARKIQKESLAMSVGELLNMYRDGELVIRPPFQRLFRWSITQKSRFIESLLIGLPVPSIFVSEIGDTARWELVDGLQRMSTVFEFMGELKEDDHLRPSPRLVATEYLPSLEGKSWEDMSRLQQFAIKRSKINVEILKRLTDSRSQYDLFQRINSGSPATRQELRNCIMSSVKPEFQKMVDTIAEDDNLAALLQLTVRGEQQLASQEAVCRLLVFGQKPYDGKLDLDDYIDQEIKELALSSVDISDLTRRAKGTFELLRNAVGDDALKRYDGMRFTGKPTNTAREIILVGIFCNYEAIRRLEDPRQFVHAKVKGTWQESVVDDARKPGSRGTDRAKKTVPFGKEWFRP